MIDKTQESGALGKPGGSEKDMKRVDRRQHGDKNKPKPCIVFTFAVVVDSVAAEGSDQKVAQGVQGSRLPQSKL